MKHNIFAYTNGEQVPGFISVNEEADDRVTVTLRSNGAQVPSCIEMPRDELANLAVAIGAHLGATAPVEAKAKK